MKNPDDAGCCYNVRSAKDSGGSWHCFLLVDLPNFLPGIITVHCHVGFQPWRLADEVPTYQPEYRTMSFLIWVPHPLTVTFLDISSIFCRACKVCEVKLFSLLSVVILLTLTSC